MTKTVTTTITQAKSVTRLPKLVTRGAGMAKSVTRRAWPYCTMNIAAAVVTAAFVASYALFWMPAAIGEADAKPGKAQECAKGTPQAKLCDKRVAEKTRR